MAKSQVPNISEVSSTSLGKVPESGKQFSAVGEAEKSSSETSEQEPNSGLRKNLTNRHIQLIALGGAIGTGLFYGSSESISLAGPSVLLAYLIGGIIIFLVVRALGEMSVEDPKAGAFSYYASEYWSKRAGFVSGWNYWFNYILVSMVELSVVGQFVNYWFPQIPQWATACVFLVGITVANLLGVRMFGEFEFWFAIIKVVAVIAMIIAGLVVVAMAVPGVGGAVASFSNLFSDGGFFPHGVMTKVAAGAGASGGQWTGFLMALVVVMFSFGGVELIGVTAGETADPKRTIPKATNDIIWRILVFYIGALTVIMAVVPWAHIGQADTNGTVISPFVQIFDSIGVKSAATILNFVCLTAVVSVYNSGLYSNSRMLYSLAEQGNAPRALSKLSKNGVPYVGVLASAAITAVAVVVVFLWPAFAFNYLMSIAMTAAIINWTMIMITQLKFRAKRRAAGITTKLDFPLPWHKVTPWIAIAFLMAVVVLMCFSPSYRPAVIVGPIWLAVLLIAYQITQVRKKRARK
jgi:AAT family amino acid transporter